MNALVIPGIAAPLIQHQPKQICSYSHILFHKFVQSVPDFPCLHDIHFMIWAFVFGHIDLPLQPGENKDVDPPFLQNVLLYTTL